MFFRKRFAGSLNMPGFDAVPGKSLAVEGRSRLHELEGRTEVTSSMTTRKCQS